MISVSGVRGVVGKDLTPEIVGRFAAAFGSLVRAGASQPLTVVLGRDARTSGPMFAASAAAGLVSVGCDVVDLGIVPTPTVQMEVEANVRGNYQIPPAVEGRTLFELNTTLAVKLGDYVVLAAAPASSASGSAIAIVVSVTAN